MIASAIVLSMSAFPLSAITLTEAAGFMMAYCDSDDSTKTELGHLSDEQFKRLKTIIRTESNEKAGNLRLIKALPLLPVIARRGASPDEAIQKY